MQCPTLLGLDSGTVSLESDGLTTTAVITCDQDYIRIGAEKMICQVNGMWNSSLPVCGKIFHRHRCLSENT